MPHKVPSASKKQVLKRMGGKKKIYFQSHKTNQQYWVQVQNSIPEEYRVLWKHTQLLKHTSYLHFLLKGRQASFAAHPHCPNRKHDTQHMPYGTFLPSP